MYILSEFTSEFNFCAVLCLWDWGRRGPKEGLEIIFIEEQNFFKCVVRA